MGVSYKDFLLGDSHMKRLVMHVAITCLLPACAHLNQETPTSLYGDSAPLSAAATTIPIHPDTKWVNVTGGEIIRFDVDGKSFAWAFNVPVGLVSFDLAKVAPAGILNRPVEAYIATDPKYSGDGDRND